MQVERECLRGERLPLIWMPLDAPTRACRIVSSVDIEDKVWILADVACEALQATDEHGPGGCLGETGGSETDTVRYSGRQQFTPVQDESVIA